MDNIKDRRKQNIMHLARIQGQINTLRKYIEGNSDCIDIAVLTASIVKSFDSFRNRVLEGNIMCQVLDSKGKISQKQQEQIKKIIKLYKI
jgi:DNA-binding FrmR family transcriptional regulator